MGSQTATRIPFCTEKRPSKNWLLPANRLRYQISAKRFGERSSSPTIWDIIYCCRPIMVKMAAVLVRVLQIKVFPIESIILPPIEIKSFCSGICSRHIRGASCSCCPHPVAPLFLRAIIALRAQTRDFGHILAVPLFLKWKLHPLNQVRRQRSIKRLCSKHTKVPKSVVSKTFGSVSHIWWLILDFISNRGSISFHPTKNEA